MTYQPNLILLQTHKMEELHDPHDTRLMGSFLGQVRKIFALYHKMGSKLLSEKGVNIHIDQLPVIMTAFYRPGISQQEIANSICRDKSSVNRTVKYLEAAGYLKVSLNLKDKRQNTLRVTAKGKKEVEKIEIARLEMEQLLKEACTTVSYEALTETVRTISDNLEKNFKL